MAGVMRRTLLRELKGVRGISTSSNFALGNKGCLIMGENGPMVYESSQFQDWDDYLKQKPLLSILPGPGLYGKLFDYQRPYKISDFTRKVARTGALTVRNANYCGLSLVNPFFKGNVGVLEHLGIIAFRELHLDSSSEWQSNPSAGYHQFAAFIKESLLETHGVSSSGIPCQFERYLEDLESPQVLEDLIVDHPTTLSNLDYNDVCMDAFWCLAREIQDPPSNIQAVLRSVGALHPHALVDALTHEVLHQFLPKQLRNHYASQAYPFTGKRVHMLSEEELGTVVVELHRHTPVHCQDYHIKPLVRTRLNIRSYCREDFTEVLRVAYPNYLRDAFTELNSQKMWHRLKVRERQPIPSLYMAPATPVTLQSS